MKNSTKSVLIGIIMMPIIALSFIDISDYKPALQDYDIELRHADGDVQRLSTELLYLQSPNRPNPVNDCVGMVFKN